MLPTLSNNLWMGTNQENSNSNTNTNCDGLETKQELSTHNVFKSMLELDQDHDWFAENHHQHLSFNNNSILFQQVDANSSSCSPTSSVFNNLEIPTSQAHYFMQQKPSFMSSLLNEIDNNNLEHGFDLSGIEFLDNNQDTRYDFADLGGSNSNTQIINTPNLCSDSSFSIAPLVQLPENGIGFGGFNENSGFLGRTSLLRPLETLPSVGEQPTLFQKRAALRKNLANNSAVSSGGISCGVLERDKGKRELSGLVCEDGEKMRKLSNGDGVLEDLGINGLGFNYDSDDFTECTKVEGFGRSGGNSSNANSSEITGGDGGGVDQKGKKKGPPAKNLMAERRRRKKLNDRLYMLRSVVPKISKMNRASILGDAIEYLKELLQRINDLHNELESTPPGSALTPTATSFHPLTPTPSVLPSRMKDKFCPSPLSSPNGQPATVEVRVREGRAVNIHMFCSRRPGLLLSTMKALDNLGLDIQQAVISCFNGFAMDIFQAEQCIEGQDVQPDQIKAVLLDSAGYRNMA